MPEVVDGWDIVGLKKKKSRPTAGGVNEFATMEEAVEDGEYILLPALSLLFIFMVQLKIKILTLLLYSACCSNLRDYVYAAPAGKRTVAWNVQATGKSYSAVLLDM